MPRNISFENGAIVAKSRFFEEAKYDVSNNKITAQFDARGAVSRYAVINKFSILTHFRSLFSINGTPLDWGIDKTVQMIGKRQVTSFQTADASFVLTQFLDLNSNCVYTRMQVAAKRDLEYVNVFGLDIDYQTYAKQFFSAYKFGSISRLLGGLVFGKPPRTEGNVIRCDLTADFYFDVASNADLRGLEKIWRFFTQYRISGNLKAGETRNFDCCMSAGDRKGYAYSDVAQCLQNFDAALSETEDYIAKIPYPAGLDEKKRAYYASLINCSLSNYKDLGRFKGFLAGIVYQSPARTYYRDGYWTVLSVLPVRPDLVRNEILTLANGIDKKTGKCPSAVKHNFKTYWGDHFDSPSFLALMIYDYIAHTGDAGILDEKCAAGSVFDAARLAMTRLQKSTDATGLLVKAGEYNRRDWCDNVFRDGYVTYDEALFARAMFAMSEFARIKGLPHEDYLAKYELAKKSINDLLWSEEKGYFVNFMTDSFTEDNLSIDTVVVVLFSLTTEERARRMLQAMEAKLESANNKEQCAGDFGTLSVWPFYKDIADTVQKSALPYCYHNGGDWPYWSAMYAYAKLMHGMDYEYPLYRWFDVNLQRGNFTPVEFFCPIHPDGSMLQAWSSTGAFVLSYPDGKFFKKTID